MERTDGAQGLPTSMRKVVVASSIGTTVERYDCFVYEIAAALVFPAQQQERV